MELADEVLNGFLNSEASEMSIMQRIISHALRICELSSQKRDFDRKSRPRPALKVIIFLEYAARKPHIAIKELFLFLRLVNIMSMRNYIIFGAEVKYQS